MDAASKDGVHGCVQTMEVSGTTAVLQINPSHEWTKTFTGNSITGSRCTPL
jgi:hypothetical protein